LKLYAEEKPSRVMDMLQKALYAFLEPIYYPKGLSMVFREMSQLYSSLQHYKEELQYALAATIFHPYGRSLEALQDSIPTTRWSMGGKEFEKLWMESMQRVWGMDGEPFCHLKPLLKSFGEQQWRQHVRTAIQSAEDVREIVYSL
jgi:hypothetical protein